MKVDNYYTILIAITGKHTSPHYYMFIPILQRLTSLGLVIILMVSCASVAKQPPVNVTTPVKVVHTNLKNDESVLIFPTNAHLNTNDNQWQVHVHGWVFEPERDSSWRNGTINTLKLALDVKKNTPEARRFEDRMAMFLVDNEGSKEVVIKIGDQFFSAPTTGSNGHFDFIAHIDHDKLKCAHTLPLQVQLPAHDQRTFSGHVQCINDTGISVISDIDDTIKQSNVLDKKQLMRNTFLKEFAAVPGMARVYQHWQQNDAAFHYVSSSPWQLYPALSEFMQGSGFPPGSMHLKLFRVKDTSFFNMFDSPEEGKIPTISQLLETYPQRQFILVGDSGEKDPEIYATIAQRYPQQIKRIYIHNINNDDARLQQVFKDLPASRWLAFKDAQQILPHYSQR